MTPDQPQPEIAADTRTPEQQRQDQIALDEAVMHIQRETVRRAGKPLYYRQSLQKLARAKERLLNAQVKDTEKRDAVVQKINGMVEFRNKFGFRCALTKKQQRKMGILPPLTSNV